VRQSAGEKSEVGELTGSEGELTLSLSFDGGGVEGITIAGNCASLFWGVLSSDDMVNACSTISLVEAVASGTNGVDQQGRKHRREDARQAPTPRGDGKQQTNVTTKSGYCGRHI
jgi:hypothetical protein